MTEQHSGRLRPTEDNTFKWFKYQYLQQVDPKEFDLDFEWTPALQQKVYDEIFRPESLTYPPSKRYESRLLRQFIEKLEEATKSQDSDDDFVNDDLMSYAAALRAESIISEAEAAQQKSYVTYGFRTRLHDDSSIGHINEITMLENRSVLSSGTTTGLRTWEAALHLGAFLCTEPGRTLIGGRNIMELGAGTALLSILCSRHLGARHVLATDGEGCLLSDITTNLFLNALDGDTQRIDVAVLRWGSWLGSLEREEIMKGDMEVILGADIVGRDQPMKNLRTNCTQTYDRRSFPALVSTIVDLLELQSEAIALISEPVRDAQTSKAFEEICSANGLEIHVIPHSPGRLPIYSFNPPVRIMKIQRHPL